MTQDIDYEAHRPALQAWLLSLGTDDTPDDPLSGANKHYIRAGLAFAAAMPKPDAPSQHSELADIAAIEANLDYLQNHEYNPFEPDNQSQAFFAVCELSKQLAPLLRKAPCTRIEALEEAANKDQDK